MIEFDEEQMIVTVQRPGNEPVRLYITLSHTCWSTHREESREFYRITTKQHPPYEERLVKFRRGEPTISSWVGRKSAYKGYEAAVCGAFDIAMKYLR